MCLASKDLFQRCLRCATQNAESFYGLVWSYCPRELIQWHACSLVVLQFNNCMCQGHTGCTAGGYGLLSWRVQHICTETRGQDVYSQEGEEDRNTPWEQGKKQRKVRNRRRKGREEQAVDDEGRTYKAGAFTTTFCKYFLGKWLEMCSFWTKFTSKSCPNQDTPADVVTWNLCGGWSDTLAKLVLRKRNLKTHLMKPKFSAVKAVHDCYQCWKFELNISDDGDMHFSAIEPRWGVVPRKCRPCHGAPACERQNVLLKWLRWGGGGRGAYACVVMVFTSQWKQFWLLPSSIVWSSVPWLVKASISRRRRKSSLLETSEEHEPQTFPVCRKIVWALTPKLLCRDKEYAHLI